jgi:hypothetical protein
MVCTAHVSIPRGGEGAECFSFWQARSVLHVYHGAANSMDVFGMAAV